MGLWRTRPSGRGRTVLLMILLSIVCPAISFMHHGFVDHAMIAGAEVEVSAANRAGSSETKPSEFNLGRELLKKRKNKKGNDKSTDEVVAEATAAKGAELTAEATVA
eukprot:evm.model.scf_136.5 EVM.evm.TU.scf_136.5   scf_136:109828-111432(+)